jgi:iron complex outermembrane receptor protein
LRSRYGRRAVLSLGASVFALSFSIAVLPVYAADDATGDAQNASPITTASNVQTDPANTQAAPPDPQAAPSDAAPVKRVVVTARRREEAEQDVPIPMTVVSGDTLAALGTYRIEDIGDLLPSVNVAMLNPRQNSIAIRGLGNNPANDGLEASGGVFLDGVYLGRPGMAVFDLTDIDQFEVLRGPQGTLFGKNTTAGALSITTRQPSFTPSVTAEYTFGNYLDSESRASITGPIYGNQIAASLSVYDTRRDGVIDAITVDGKENAHDRLGARAQFLFKPNSALTVRFIAEYDDEFDSCCVATFYKATPNNTYFKLLNSIAAQGYDIAIPSTDPYARETVNNDYQKIKVIQSGLTLQSDYRFGDGYDLTSITAFRTWDFKPYNDADSTSLSIIPYGGVENSDHQVSQELRVASPKDQLIDYTSGLYYFYQGQDTDQSIQYGNNAQLVGDYLGSPALGKVYVDKDITVLAHLRTESYAAFSQADWNATKDLTFTLGLRNTYERKDMEIWRNLDGTSTSPLINPNYQADNVSTVDNNVGATIAADYKWTPDFSTYASLSHGAKAGATNNSPPNSLPLDKSGLIVRPEKIDDGEIGFKSDAWNHRLTFNGNLFYSLVQDYQATSIYVDPTTGLSGSILTNTGWVQTKGAEFDSAVRPLRGLKLDWSGGYNNTTYRSFRNGPCAAEYGLPATATCDLTGRPVVGAPKWTSSVSADYRHELHDDLIGYAVAEYAYKSSYFGFIDDSEASKINGYGITNIRVGTQAVNGHLDLSVWARNLFNTDYYNILSVAQTRGAYFGYVGDPRTFGFTIKVSL